MIKLINYGRYGSGEVFISKMMIHSMQREDDMTRITMQGGCSYTVKETPEEILAMPDIEEGNKAIDWEQRRYEIAMRYAAHNFMFESPNPTAVQAIEFADALIDKLKGGEK